MINIELNHSLTPQQLSDINHNIALVISSDTPDFKKLNELIKQRDELILQHLTTLDESARKQFAEAELKTNNKLKDLARDLLSNAKEDVTKFLRSQAAAKKYQE